MNASKSSEAEKSTDVATHSSHLGSFHLLLLLLLLSLHLFLLNLFDLFKIASPAPPLVWDFRQSLRFSNPSPFRRKNSSHPDKRLPELEIREATKGSLALLLLLQTKQALGEQLQRIFLSPGKKVEKNRCHQPPTFPLQLQPEQITVIVPIIPVGKLMERSPRRNSWKE